MESAHSKGKRREGFDQGFGREIVWRQELKFYLARPRLVSPILALMYKFLAIVRKKSFLFLVRSHQQEKYFPRQSLACPCLAKRSLGLKKATN